MDPQESVQDYGVTTADWASFVAATDDVLARVRLYIGSDAYSIAVVLNLLLAALFFLLVINGFLALPLNKAVLLAIALPTVGVFALYGVRLLELRWINAELNTACPNGIATSFVPHSSPSHGSIRIYAYKSATMILATAARSTVVPPTKPGQPALWKILHSPRSSDGVIDMSDQGAHPPPPPHVEMMDSRALLPRGPTVARAALPAAASPVFADVENPSLN